MPTSTKIEHKVAIPDGVKCDVKDDILMVKGPKGSLERSFRHPKIELKVGNKEVVVQCDLPRKRDGAIAGTWHGHIKNMVQGVQEEFEYQLKIVYAHFPIKVKVTGDKKRVEIQNFIGENFSRYANILEDTEVKISGDIIVVKSPNIEYAGQTAANIETATRITGYDTRVFQDGIYIIKKAHRVL